MSRRRACRPQASCKVINDTPWVVRICGMSNIRAMLWGLLALDGALA